MSQNMFPYLIRRFHKNKRWSFCSFRKLLFLYIAATPVGGSIFWIASIFQGSGLTPSAVNRWPMKGISVHFSSSFSLFNFRFLSWHLFNSFRRLASWSLVASSMSPRPVIRMSSATLNYRKFLLGLPGSGPAFFGNTLEPGISRKASVGIGTCPRGSGMWSACWIHYQVEFGGIHLWGLPLKTLWHLATLGVCLRWLVEDNDSS